MVEKFVNDSFYTLFWTFSTKRVSKVKRASPRLGYITTNYNYMYRIASFALLNKWKNDQFWQNVKRRLPKTCVCTLNIVT